MSSRMQRSSISPFRSHKAPAVPASKPGARPTTPSSISARTNTMSSSSSSARPTTPSSAGRPTTPSSSMSSAAVARGSASSRISPVSGATSSFSYPVSDRLEVSKAKENVTVTVRFRPLSAREIGKGDEIAWYADGQSTVRNEYNPSIAYGFDRVFGPATTTRHVYDVAAHYVVSGAMQGINGTVFAYGVTSSGKTHTMHGEQKSPGIIPLAVKDVFSIIQETPGREFLLRVSYLEIYNEVINDLLDPAGQNLRIREDSQGTYVEGIKEEVVLSPAHALSLIASGEEHRHVGSNNFNLLSSRSHTIFTLTIESSPSNENDEDEEVTLSQLNLIDLAGSESSKTETTGLRRKEGSYINKSLLTLGTVISKLTDDKATHIPYRDSKLTRLLQSSLSGHGRISLICTVTPASSNSEETHNTLKFAHRSKHVEIQASQNKIIDEKSLIKKYQREISCLKEELQQLRHGIMEKHSSFGQEDIVNLKLQLEAGHVKLLSRLEEEEQAKAALMGRIQRLTKLILVSTKNTLSSKVSGMGVQRRRHSFGEDELAYLPDRKREYITEDDVGSNESELSEGRSANIGLDPMKFDKKNRKRGVLGWLKFKKSEQFHGLSPNADYESSTSGSPFQASQQRIISEVTDARRNSLSQKGDDVSLLNYIPEKTQAGDLFTATTNGRQPVPTGITIMDEMDLLSEQVKLLAGEIALCTSSLKRLAEQASNNPKDPSIQEQMQSLKDEINVKKRQMHVLEQRLIGSLDEDASLSSNSLKMSQALSKLTNELGEKTFEHEIMAADNRILQDQLQMKVSENAKLQETVKTLYAQIDYYIGKTNENGPTPSKSYLNNSSIENETDGIPKESTSIWLSPMSMNECQAGSSDQSLRTQVLKQASEIENLKQKKEILEEEKRCLRNDCQKLVEEASYARDLAAAAAVELRNLAEEVTKLSYENTRLTDELAASKESTTGKISNFRNQFLLGENDSGDYFKKSDDSFHVEELKKELLRRSERESSLETALTLSVQKECELQKCIDNAKKREQDLENELANMWVTVAKLKRNGVFPDVNTSEGIEFSNFQKPDLLGESDADEYFKKSEDNILLEELQKELLRRPERESSLETALTLSVQREQELEKSVDNARKHEQVLENELANMWVTISKHQRNGMAPDVIKCGDIGEPGFHPLRKGSSIENGCSGVKCKGGIFSDVWNEDQISSFEEPKYAFDYEKKRCKELQAIISKVKAEDLDGIDFKALEEMQDFHVEALSKICQEKLKDRVRLNQVGGTAN